MNVRSEVELGAPDGVRLVTIGLGFSLYIREPLSSCASELLRFHDAFVHEYPPPGILKFYATENMRQHKRITKATLSMLPTWLKADAPPREYVCLQMKDGDHHQSAPHHKVEVYGIEARSKLFNRGRANIVSLLIPFVTEAAGQEKFRDKFIEACSGFPIQSAIGGLTFECSRYEKESSQTHAWSQSMRLKATDICRIPEDAIAVGVDGLKGIGWLTALGVEALEPIGGASQLRRQLPSEIEIIPIPGGVVFQIGKAPIAGDANRAEDLSSYVALYLLLRPMIDLAAKRSISFNLEKDYVERTEAWFGRLGNP